VNGPAPEPAPHPAPEPAPHPAPDPAGAHRDGPGAALVVEGVSVRFEGADRPALDAVDLSVAAGDLVALLGPSGCGKTTLLRVVAGLVVPDRGRVVLDGDDLTGVPVHRRGVGLMFQDYALFPHRDVGGNVEFGLRMGAMGAAERRARVAEVLALVGLSGWERRPVGPLSGGEQQRVALARALAPSPRLLLLDEPLGALDRGLRDRLVPELRELFRAVGVTVVHVTHDQSEALALADRVVVMDHGAVVQDAPPAEVWARPASALVARFLGFANVLDTPEGPVLVRPESVRLTRPAAAPHPAHVGEADRAEAEVVSVLFRGDHSVVRVRRRSDGTELEAVVATTAGPRWVPGDPVDVAIERAGVQPLGR
jgi:thiamine transport system ATP-binding protein